MEWAKPRRASGMRNDEKPHRSQARLSKVCRARRDCMYIVLSRVPPSTLMPTIYTICTTFACTVQANKGYKDAYTTCCLYYCYSTVVCMHIFSKVGGWIWVGTPQACQGCIMARMPGVGDKTEARDETTSRGDGLAFRTRSHSLPLAHL